MPLDNDITTGLLSQGNQLLKFADWSNKFDLAMRHASMFSNNARLMEAMQRSLVLQPDFCSPALFANISVATEALRSIGRAPWLNRLHYDFSAMDRALKTAATINAVALPSVLQSYRTDVEPLAAKLLHVHTYDWWRDDRHLAAFAHFSAFSDLLAKTTRVGRLLEEATRAINLINVAGFSTLRDYGRFLDAAGLRLSHWPRSRLLSVAEKRKRLKARLRGHTQPSHYRLAISLVHRYELLLREMIDAAMAGAYGEDWANQRLVDCDCKDLLGKMAEAWR